jgi:hypothetical protein
MREYPFILDIRSLQQNPFESSSPRSTTLWKQSPCHQECDAASRSLLSSSILSLLSPLPSVRPPPPSVSPRPPPWPPACAMKVLMPPAPTTPARRRCLSTKTIPQKTIPHLHTRAHDYNKTLKGADDRHTRTSTAHNLKGLRFTVHGLGS